MAETAKKAAKKASKSNKEIEFNEFEQWILDNPKKGKIALSWEFNQQNASILEQRLGFHDDKPKTYEQIAKGLDISSEEVESICKRTARRIWRNR